MKFTNGYWLLKEGLEAHYAATAIDAEKQGNARPEAPRGLDKYFFLVYIYIIMGV